MLLFNFKKPHFMIALLNVLGYGILMFMYPESTKELFVMGFMVTVILILSCGIIHKMSSKDAYIFLIVSMLFSIGEIMLLRLDIMYGRKQILWLMVSLVCFFIVYFAVLKLNIWDRLHYFYYILAVLLFVLTLIFGITVGGSKNWIVIKGISFQPSEIVKLLAVFIMADRYAHPEKYRFKKLNEDVTLSLLIYSLLMFLVIQREWGTAVLIFLVHISLMYVFSRNKMAILLNTLGAVAGAVLGFYFVSHIKVRVDVWLNPWEDIAGKGYQITQSLFAIGSGGFFGSGIGLGSPEDIPEVHSDFIFSAICEEFGILGGIAVIMLFFIMVYRGIRLSMQTNNTFYKVLSAGISIMFGFQAFIILGGVTKFIPLTGITLPFISYGGSSLLTSFLAIAVLQAASNKEAYLTETEQS